MIWSHLIGHFLQEIRQVSRLHLTVKNISAYVRGRVLPAICELLIMSSRTIDRGGDSASYPVSGRISVGSAIVWSVAIEVTAVPTAKYSMTWLPQP